MIHWLLIRTDIASTAKEMLIKLCIFIGGTLIESITTDYLKEIRTPKRTYKMCTQSLKELGVVDDDLKMISIGSGILEITCTYLPYQIVSITTTMTLFLRHEQLKHFEIILKL